MKDSLPSWLDETFLNAVLQKEDVKMMDFSAKPALAAGENYCSHIYRVTVHYVTCQSTEEKVMSLIIKASIVEGVLMNVIDDTEARVYKELLPIMEAKSNCKFGPKILHSPRKDVLIMEDLSSEGYLTCNRFEQIDFPHCKLAIETLAKYHASTVAYHHENPQMVEDIGKEKGYTDNGSFSTGIKSMMMVCMNQFSKLITTMDIEQKTREFICNRTEGLWESVVNLHKPKSNSFNVLNHGDFWTNNILFKHDEAGVPIDVKFIDFQFPKYASPMLDLIYFIWGSSNEEVREHKLDELYSIYLKTLNLSLEVLECDERFTAEELYKTLNSYVDIAIISLCFDLPFFLCKSEDTYSFENLTDKDMEKVSRDEKFLKMINGEQYCKILPARVKHFEKHFRSLW